MPALARSVKLFGPALGAEEKETDTISAAFMHGINRLEVMTRGCASFRLASSHDLGKDLPCQPTREVES